MPSLNFKSRFVPLIESGEKRQTIRPIRKKNPIKVGDKLYLFTGLRTKGCKRLIINPLKIKTYRNPKTAYVGVICGSVELINIQKNVIYIDEVLLSVYGERQLAEDDGFESLKDFINFFETKYGLPFEGVLIKW